jgi:hypothetical protein
MRPRAATPHSPPADPRGPGSTITHGAAAASAAPLRVSVRGQVAHAPSRRGGARHAAVHVPSRIMPEQTGQSSTAPATAGRAQGDDEGSGAADRGFGGANGGASLSSPNSKNADRFVDGDGYHDIGGAAHSLASAAAPPATSWMAELPAPESRVVHGHISLPHPEDAHDADAAALIALFSRPGGCAAHEVDAMVAQIRGTAVRAADDRWGRHFATLRDRYRESLALQQQLPRERRR